MKDGLTEPQSLDDIGWNGAAEFSEDGAHRLSLARWWGDGPRAVVCGANPSRAGAATNDPTIWRVMRLLYARGFGGFIMLNWETYIATSPEDMHKWREAVDHAEHQAAVERNLDIIRLASRQADMRFVAWGNLVPFVPQTSKVLRALSLEVTEPLYAFGLTKGGKPKHPMARGNHRIPNDWEPVVWRGVRQESVT